tara:strand:+ start:1884 stop:2741 length:858 start_codon:yes stop_codon:yes gene_type:complete
MVMQNFWFTYQNILKREILKKNYFSFFRKIFGSLYKFIIKFFRQIFSINCINLDKIDKEELFKSNLDDLFINFNCDKGTHFYYQKEKILSHNYSIYYEKYLKDLKEKKINFLELGSHEGKSLASFYFYFPKAKLIGANINPFQMRYRSKRITELFVDVSSKEILKSLSDYLGDELDIIVDDASHNLRDIIIAFSIFFKNLKKGGIYIIEDINQFEVFKELNPYINEITPLEILQKIQRKEIFKSSFLDEETKKYLIDNISDIKIEKGSMIIKEKNISDIVFIFKK